MYTQAIEKETLESIKNVLLVRVSKGQLSASQALKEYEEALFQHTIKDII